MLYDLFIEKTGQKWEKKWIRRPLELERELPLMVKYAGFARWPADMEVNRCKSNLFAIEYVCAGNADFFQGNNHYSINKGSLYLLRKNVDHVYKTGSAGILFKRFITIDGYDLDNLLTYLRLSDKDFIIPEKSKPIHDLLKRCTTILSNPSAPNLLIELSTLVYQMLLVLSYSTPVRFPATIERVLKFMNKNLHLPLSRREICDYTGISKVSLNRMFQKYLHQSPMAYFMNMKIQWAGNILKSTRLSVKEITYKIGMDNQFYFSSLFKKHFGVSPKTYREAMDD